MELNQLKLVLDEMSKENADLSKRLEIAENERAELKNLVKQLEATNQMQKETIKQVTHERDELAQKAEHAFGRAANANLEKEMAEQALEETQQKLQHAQEENKVLSS